MKRKVSSLLLALAIMLGLFTMFPTGSSAASYKQSGLTTLPKLTQGEIVDLLEAAPVVETQFAEEPNLTAPYSAGKLTDASLQAALARVNLYRRVAGLDSVTLDSQFTAASQTAAMLMAVNNRISHYPAQPEDMSQELYDLASEGAIRSNLGHIRSKASLIYTAIDLCMDDTDSSNFDRLGHRRWILDPAAVKTGFGYAVNKGSFGVMYVVDSSRDKTISASDFDFIAWPSTCNFPATLFDRDQAWSVSLNPELYTAPEKYTEDFSMAITFPDGTTQNISRSYPLVYTDDCSEPFLHIASSNTGSVPLCVIFRPDMTGYDEYPLGTYTVTFHGLKTKTGQATELSYQVSFFDPDLVVRESENTSKNEENLGQNGADPSQSVDNTAQNDANTASDVDNAVVFADVAVGDWYYDAVQYAVKNGLFNGVGGNAFSPDGTMTRSMVMTVLARMYGEDTTPLKGETWDIRGKRWAVSRRISDGLNTENPITPQELAVMLYRLTGENPAEEDLLSTVPDGSEVDSWARDAVNWALSTGLLRGDTQGCLSPKRSATRAQVATMLQRYLEGE